MATSRSGPHKQRILLSQRGHILFHEHARVHVDQGVVVAEIADDQRAQSFTLNIPHANTSLLLLGEGTSITRDAARMLGEQSVLVGFTGRGATPLASATGEAGLIPDFLEGQEAYRPVEDARAWAQIVLDPQRRLEAAKALLRHRLDWTERLWDASEALADYGLSVQDKKIRQARQRFEQAIREAEDETDLLAAEGRYAQAVYAYCADCLLETDDFQRTPAGTDKATLNGQANQFLDHGNYLIYGAAAVSLHAIGIPLGFVALHGKTRRGGMVFDLADLFKDGLSVPQAMRCAREGYSEGRFRHELVEQIQHQALIREGIEALREVMAQC